uniref:dentin sialophosphoprotein-like n=1 Tax=Styela clava TaxID=7725 RepID=UPI00193A335B|nr:dentin sialophosphoprotein-like [Styela clava]
MLDKYIERNCALPAQTALHCSPERPSGVDGNSTQFHKNGDSSLMPTELEFLQQSKTGQINDDKRLCFENSETTENPYRCNFFEKFNMQFDIKDLDTSHTDNCTDSVKFMDERTLFEKLFEEQAEYEQFLVDKAKEELEVQKQDSVTQIINQKSISPPPMDDMDISDIIYEFRSSSEDESGSQCFKCGMKFFRAIDLKRHRRYHAKKHMSKSRRTFSKIVDRLLKNSKITKSLLSKNSKIDESSLHPNSTDDSLEFVQNSQNGESSPFKILDISSLWNCFVKLEKLRDHKKYLSKFGVSSHEEPASLEHDINDNVKTTCVPMDSSQEMESKNNKVPSRPQKEMIENQKTQNIDGVSKPTIDLNDKITHKSEKLKILSEKQTTKNNDSEPTKNAKITQESPLQNEMVENQKIPNIDSVPKPTICLTTARTQKSGKQRKLGENQVTHNIDDVPEPTIDSNAKITQDKEPEKLKKSNEKQKTRTIDGEPTIDLNEKITQKPEKRKKLSGSKKTQNNVDEPSADANAQITQKSEKRRKLIGNQKTHNFDGLPQPSTGANAETTQDSDVQSSKKQKTKNNDGEPTLDLFEKIIQEPEKRKKLSGNEKTQNIGSFPITHDSDKQCHICYKTFSQKCQVRRHLRNAHRSDPKSVTTQESEKQETLDTQKESSEICDTQNKDSDTTTTTDSDLQCHICSETFTQESHVRRHLRDIHEFDINANSEITRQSDKQEILLTREDIQKTRSDDSITTADSGMQCHIQKTITQKSHVRRHLRNAHNSDPISDTNANLDKQTLLTQEESSEIRDTQNKDRITTTLDSDLQCHICRKTFTRNSHVIRHLRTVHEFDMNEYAKMTQKSDKQEDPDFDRVPISFDNDKECHICHKTFSRKRHVRRHLNDVHKSKPKSDIIANSETTRMSDKQEILLTHKDSSEIKDTQNKDSITTTPNSDLQCHICRKTFMRNSHVRRHLRTIHEFDMNEYAKMTQKSDKQEDSIENQDFDGVPISPDNDKQCHICHKMFARSRNVRRHLKDVHKSDCLPCSLCDRKFPRKCDLMNHINYVHKNERKGARDISCGICGNQYSSQPILQKHMRKHLSKIGKYSCINDKNVQNCIKEPNNAVENGIGEETVATSITANFHNDCDSSVHKQAHATKEHSNRKIQSSCTKDDIPNDDEPCIHQDESSDFNCSDNSPVIALRPQRKDRNAATKKQLLLDWLKSDRTSQNQNLREADENEEVTSEPVCNKDSNAATKRQLFTVDKLEPDITGLDQNLREADENEEVTSENVCNKEQWHTDDGLESDISSQNQIFSNTDGNEDSASESVCNILNSDQREPANHILSDTPELPTIPLNIRKKKRKKHICIACGKRFRKTKILKQHMEKVHLAKVQPFHCEKCKKRFSTYSKFRKHTMNVHPENEQVYFNCKHCNLTFAKKSRLKKHKKHFHKIKKRSKQSKTRKNRSENKTSAKDAKSCREEEPSDTKNVKSLELGRESTFVIERSFGDADSKFHEMELCNNIDSLANPDKTYSSTQNTVVPDSVKNNLNIESSRNESEKSITHNVDLDAKISSSNSENTSGSQTFKKNLSSYNADFYIAISSSDIASVDLDAVEDVREVGSTCNSNLDDDETSACESQDSNLGVESAKMGKIIRDYCSCALCKKTLQLPKLSYNSADDVEDGQLDLSKIAESDQDVNEFAQDTDSSQELTFCNGSVKESPKTTDTLKPCPVCRKKSCVSLICAQAMEHTYSLITSKNFTW